MKLRQTRADREEKRSRSTAEEKVVLLFLDFLVASRNKAHALVRGAGK